MSGSVYAIFAGGFFIGFSAGMFAVMAWWNYTLKEINRASKEPTP